MYQEILDAAGNWSAILTALVAVVAYGRYVIEDRQRRRALEDYLRDEKLRDIDSGQRSLIQLSANLSMTEEQVLKAAFQSSVVSTSPGIDRDGNADRLLFEYCGEDLKLPRRF